MNYLNFANLCDTDGCPAVITITGIEPAVDESPAKVYYVTGSVDSPDWFFMDSAIQTYFSAYLHNNQLDSLIGRAFKINYEITGYEPDRADDYFDVEDDGNLAVELYSITEVTAI